MRAEAVLPFDTAGLAGDLAASFNHGLSNGSTFYSRPTTTLKHSILTMMLNMIISHQLATH